MLRVDDPPLLLAAAAGFLLDGAESPPCAGESDRQQAAHTAGRSGCLWVCRVVTALSVSQHA